MEPDVLERILDGREKPTNLPLALLENITAHFSKEREIGHGGFATVYKGILSNGNVAVKRIRSNHTIDEKLFYREVSSLMATNHPNIVRFVGFCASTDQIAIEKEGSRELIYAEIRERLLCFEYISNGSLQKYITDELRGLDWSTRYRLIKGICNGLHYLHMEKHIYHMDLKPANVLLDNEMVPKITDFGLARLDEKSQTMSIDRCGSLGYCAPEYLQRGKMSFKSDIYSLGIIIIELVTGEKSIPDNNKNNVLRRWRHRWKKTGKESPLCYQQVTKCIDIGLLCQEIDPCQRPFISEIIHDISKMECTTGKISVDANESTFGPINHYMEDDILGIEPLELHFSFELNTQMSCSLQLTNETNSYIAFNIQKTSPLPYCIQPHTGIVPPQSKSSVNITLQPQDKAPRDMQHADEFIVRSTRVNDGIAVENITTEMFNKETSSAVDEVNLDVVFDAQPQSELVDVLNSVQQAESVILGGPSRGISAYLDAVDKLRGAEDFFTSKISCKAGDDVLRRVNELLPKAAIELANDFRWLLSKCSKPVELELLFNCVPSHSSSEDPSEGRLNLGALPTLVDPRYKPLLSKLVQKSVELGRHKQFLKIYRDIRSSTLELTLKQLGEYVAAEEVQAAQVESLNAKIAQWIQCLQIAVKVLFASERVLCDQIFEGTHGLKDHCFAAVTSKSLLTLLSFGQAIAKSKSSPEKVFLLLDMFKATLEIQSEVEVVFGGDEWSENRKSAISLVKCLAGATKETLGDFKDNIAKESPKSTTPDGDVHPITSYVGNYIKFLFDYQSSLELIFQESSNGDGTNSGLVSEITGVVHALETNLDVKAKQYKDLALGNLFVMNNISYIVRSMCSSKVKDIFGDDWVQRRRRIVQQNATQYKRVAWAKVLECLSAQGLTSSVGSTTEVTLGSIGNIGSHSGTTSTSVIKGRFRSFNKQFEEVCQTQINWAIPDRELRDNLILAVAEIVSPAYRSFVKRFGPLVENSHNASKYIKYTPEALEQALGNLFAKKSVQ